MYFAFKAQKIRFGTELFRYIQLKKSNFQWVFLTLKFKFKKQADRNNKLFSQIIMRFMILS